MRHDLPRPGDVIAGKYRVRAVLGRGRGMLYEAEHTAFEQRVAIRVVSPQIADEVEVSKFRREARALAKLGSEHVARILDVGVLPDGSFYLVRQYLEGEGLASYLKQRRQLGIDEAVGLILQVTEAVAETHAYGILLRELSPEQLFLAERSPGVRGGPRVLKVIDFGTAKLLREAQPGAVEDYTATTVMGLSPYSSPEMVRRQRDIDVRTDVWSLGAILYEMLAGQPPFGVDPLSLAISITRDEPIPLSRHRRDVPVELETAIRCTLMKDRGSRLADTHAFAAALARFAPPEGRALMERIRDLASSARQRLGGEADEEMEISDVEEMDEETGDGEDVATRVGHVQEFLPKPAFGGGPVLAGAAAPAQAQAAPAPAKTAPVPRRSVSQEKTEALGFNFVPSDPMLAGLLNKGSTPPPARDTGPKPTQLLPVVSGPPPGFGQPPKTTPPPPPAPPAPASAPTNPDTGAAHAAAPGAPPAGGFAPQGMPLGMPSAPASVPGPQSAPDPSVPAWMHTGGAAVPVSAGAQAAQARTRKIAIFAIVGGLVALLLMVVAIIVLPNGGPPALAGADSAKPESKSTADATSTSPAGTSEPASTSTGVTTSEPATTSEPVATADPKATAATSAKPKSTSSPVATGTTATPTATATSKPTATATATAEPPKGGGDNGTLVLVATGGTCAFSVNGQAKGTTNSMKLTVPPGNYAVTCKPSSGSSKSKSVQVKSGGTAMAMFKL